MVDVIVAGQMLELLDEIVAEQLGPRDAGRVGAGLVQPGEGARGDRPRDLPRIIDAQLGISERALLARSRVGRGAVFDIAASAWRRLATDSS